MDKKIIGKWQIVCWKVITPSGWQVIEDYPSDRYKWEFCTDGKLLETTSPLHTDDFDYFVTPSQLLLTIDRSDYACDGYMLACIEECFRIKTITDRFMTLYDLDDISADDPDQYCYMVELERL